MTNVSQNNAKAPSKGIEQWTWWLWAIPVALAYTFLKDTLSAYVALLIGSFAGAMLQGLVLWCLNQDRNDHSGRINSVSDGPSDESRILEEMIARSRFGEQVPSDDHQTTSESQRTPT